MKDKPTHDELAERWLDANPNTRIVGVQWWRYSGIQWEALEPGVVESEILEYLIAAKPEGIKPTSTLTESVTYICEKKRRLGASVLESNFDILPCQNGVLTLSSRELLPHCPEHYNISVLPYAYEPTAHATRWHYFLDTTLAAEVAAFYQEFAGYCLTIETALEIAVWLCGPMGSGKTTALLGLVTMLGKRAAMLGLAEMESSRFALYDVPGKTLLWATEAPTGSIKITNLINRIISGEAIYTEKKYEHARQITPHAKIAWAMNDLPNITRATDGIFRRVKVIEFHKREGDIIPEIKEEIQNEGAGILNWALEGLDRLRVRGSFSVPASIQNATQDYRDQSDHAKAFLLEHIQGDDHSEGATLLYNAYAEYCKSVGVKQADIKSMAEVAKDWERLGLTKYMVNGRVRWRGVYLRKSEL